MKVNGQRQMVMNPVIVKPRRDGMLLARCWCQFTTVLVPASEIRNGRTGCCTSDACVRMREVAMNAR